MVEEWIRNARDEVIAEAHSWANVERALGALKEEHAELIKKLKEAESARLSAEASLKTVEAQAKDQHKKLYTTELELATQKQFVTDLKAEQKKAKDAAERAVCVAKEATEVVEKTSYEHRVMDTEARLAEEVAIVCRDYCTESWGVAMDRAGVPADSKLRRSESIFFPGDIWEIPTELPPSSALPLPPPKRPLIIQDSSFDDKVAIETEKGKEVPSPAQAS